MRGRRSRDTRRQARISSESGNAGRAKRAHEARKKRRRQAPEPTPAWGRRPETGDDALRRRPDSARVRRSTLGGTRKVDMRGCRGACPAWGLVGRWAGGWSVARSARVVAILERRAARLRRQHAPARDAADLERAGCGAELAPSRPASAHRRPQNRTRLTTVTARKLRQDAAFRACRARRNGVASR